MRLFCSKDWEAPSIEGCVALYPSSQLVRYRSELLGESEFFKRAARLSKRKCVTFALCDTDNYGVLRRSVAVSDSGKLIGVSDAAVTTIGGKYSPSIDRPKVYELSVGKIGVVTDADLYLPSILESLADSGADLVVCPHKTITSPITAVTARALSHAYGVAIFVASPNYSFVSDIRGELAFSSPNGFLYDCKIEKDYRQFSIRRRGGIITEEV